MKASEILEMDESSKTERGWLREIAYQLACLNESKPVKFSQVFDTDVVQLTPQRKKK